MADISTWTYAGDVGAGNAHGAYWYGSAWETSTNTTDNYSTVSWSISAQYFCKQGYTWGGESRPTAGYLDMIINDSVVGTMTVPINRGWGNGQDIGSKSGSLTIYHNSDGSGSFKFRIRIRSGTDQKGAGVVYDPWETGDVWKNLTTIPRASQPSTSTNSPTAGVAFTVYTNRKSSSFSHTIYYEIRYGGNNGTHVKAASGVGDSVSITVPESVFDSAGNYSSLACRILCDTYSGSTKIGDTKYTDTILYTNNDMKPTISSAGLSETNSRVSSKGSNITVRYLSRKTATCKIGTKHGASVSSVTVVNGNLTVSMSNSNGTWTSNSMTNLQTGTYLITVIDSRGLKATQQISQTYHAYAYPSVTGSANRSSSTGSSGTVSITGTYWNGLGNTASITYRRSTESSSHALSATPSNGKISGSVSYSDLNYQTAYSWDVTITDGFGETVRDTVTLPQAQPALFIGKNSITVPRLNAEAWSSGMGRLASANVLHGNENVTGGSVRMFMATSSMTSGKPSKDGFIVHFAWDNTGWDTQVAVADAGGYDAGPRAIELRGWTASNGSQQVGNWYSAGLLAYPVGSIYMSVNSTSPATLFGGTWTEITGRFLLAHDSSHPAGSTGGEFSTTLTVDTMPTHRHEQYVTANDGGSAVRNDYSSDQHGYAYAQGVSTSYTGGGKAHNNTPPYLSVYMWKRTG